MHPPWRAILCLLAALGAASALRVRAQPLPSDDVSEPSAMASEASGASAPDAGPPRASWSLQLSAGVGVGSRELDLPADGLIYQTRTGLFPAVDLGFELDRHTSEAFTVGLLLRYQSSLGLRIVEQLTDGGEHPRDTRSHRLDIAITPTLRLDAAGRWALCAAVGYGISDLHPEGHLVTPAYFLAGPYLRLELQLPLWAERLRLRLGPEAQWIAQVGQELVDRNVATSGLGLGAAAALEVTLGPRWTVSATYRELRVSLGSRASGSFEDASRFVTARLMGSL